jgi:hypothetical protein
VLHLGCRRPLTLLHSSSTCECRWRSLSPAWVDAQGGAWQAEHGWIAQSHVLLDHRLMRFIQTVEAMSDGVKRMVVIHKLDGDLYACAVSTTSRTDRPLSMIKGEWAGCARSRANMGAPLSASVCSMALSHITWLTLGIPQTDELIPLFDSTEQSIDRILGTFTSA